MKILLISYYFEPFEGVGAKRTSYWYKRLKEKHSVIVLTAIPQEKTNDNIIYIEPIKKPTFLSKIILDEGLKWLPALKNYLRNNPESYDSIIISGGPFMQMLISKFLKSRTSAKIILDFRDPFYANPRFNTNKIKDTVKLYFQNRFLKYADQVITVNQYCVNLIKYDNIKIIDNGFNEETLSQIPQQKTILKKMISIGRVDSDFNIDFFNQIIQKNTPSNFYYYGKDTDKFQNLKTSNISFPIDYQEILKEIASSEVCILFTGGHPFESTTKIFDFLALNKKILIITQGKPETGSLNDITKEYPNIYWSGNTPEKIETQLEQIFNQPTINFDINRYSRDYGFQKLLKLLEK